MQAGYGEALACVILPDYPDAVSRKSIKKETRLRLGRSAPRLQRRFNHDIIGMAQGQRCNGSAPSSITEHIRKRSVRIRSGIGEALQTIHAD